MRRFLAASALALLLPMSARAALISEVAWAGSSLSTADEWLEVCGPPGTDLSGWSIEGASASPLVFADGTAIPPSGAFLIANYGADDPKSTLSAAPDLVTTAVALSNSALAIVLKDASGAVIDAAGSGSAPPAGTSGETKASMERSDPSADGTRPEAWVTAAVASGFDADAPELGTPGSCATPTTAMPEEAPSSATSTEETPVEPEASEAPGPRPEPMGAVRVSEIYPSPPSGEKEWVELVNPSSAGEFLDGWTLEDARGTKTALDGLLLPWERRLIVAPKGSLNNDGDAVILRDRFGRIVHRVDYAGIARGEAFMRLEFQDAFAVTTTPTPGTANVLTEEAPEVEEPVPAEAPATPDMSPPSSSRPERSGAEGSGLPADPSTSLGMTKKDEDVKKEVAPKAPPKKPAVKPKAVTASRYKGSGLVATIVVPPGVYAKTRAYIDRGDGIEELRFSKSVADAWGVGDRISFVAQEKSEGAVRFLLANPNSVRLVGSASASFATTEAWPDETGGYRFVAEVASIRGNALEVTLAGVEGDVLAPVGSVGALKPGDMVRVEGFIAPGPRPQVFLPSASALRLELPRVADADIAVASRTSLPASVAAALTLLAAGAGLMAYLRMQRLKRLALTQSPIETPTWE